MRRRREESVVEFEVVPIDMTEATSEEYVGPAEIWKRHDLLSQHSQHLH